MVYVLAYVEFLLAHKDIFFMFRSYLFDGKNQTQKNKDLSLLCFCGI